MARRRELSAHLRLPRRWRHVSDYLQAQDPDLRIRQSVERPGWFVLERRCRRRPATNTSMPDLTDMHVQARDGFIHVAIVHPEYLNKPWNIIRALRTEGVDLWAYTAPEAFADEVEYEERWQRETRRRRRRDDGLAYYREMFDILGRVGNPEGRNERTRFSNPGLGPVAEAERMTRQGREESTHAMAN